MELEPPMEEEELPTTQTPAASRSDERRAADHEAQSQVKKER